ncbi:MAG: phosphoribosylanthranilate isomerase [Planctomycetes bacterium]|nr:phosphoribosylanthranilate isomerase [Planctomycetota bacterium]
MTQFLNNQHGVGIKVCGLRTEDDVDIATGAGANAIGFMFVESSPRHISIEVANRLVLQLPEDVLAVAVLQNYGSLSDFENWSGWLQLCGEEDESEIASAPRPVIKAFKWDLEELFRWDACQNVKALLVDGSTGGLGEQFDVTKLAQLIPSLAKPVIIAGGLTSSNVASIIKQANPAAVDVSSGIESSIGTKDHQKMCDFINAVRSE